MILREKIINLIPDRHWKAGYFLYDDLGEGGGPRIQILYLEDKKAKTRTVEAVNYGDEDGAGGWDCDVWASDVQVIVAKYLPPKISFNQFVGKLAIAMQLVPPDYAIGSEIVPLESDDVATEDDGPTAWEGSILRQIVAALPEVKH